MSRVVVLFKKEAPHVPLPKYSSEGAAGMDLSVWFPHPRGSYHLQPQEVHLFPTGVSIEIPPGYEGQVRSRSSLSTQHKIVVVNSPGTIDSDYRGSLIVALINLGRIPFIVEDGMRVAQLIISPVVRASIEEALELSPSIRGTQGFGSTGMH